MFPRRWWNVKGTENAARMEMMVCGGFRLLPWFSCTYQGTRDINYCFLSHALSMPFLFDLVLLEQGKVLWWRLMRVLILSIAPEYKHLSTNQGPFVPGGKMGRRQTHTAQAQLD